MKNRRRDATKAWAGHPFNLIRVNMDGKILNTRFTVAVAGAAAADTCTGDAGVGREGSTYCYREETCCTIK